MKILIAMDSFKGTLTAPDACDVVRQGILSVRPDVQVVVKPMADGGEGTAMAMIAARQGEWIPKRVKGPLWSMEVEAGYAWFPADQEALVEMATASGLTLLKPNELNPLRTTTYGTGQLIRAAVRKGARRICLAVGGSATVDGGVGAAGALGWTFLDDQGKPVELCGGALSKIASVRCPATMDLPPVEVLCDVDNPLCGEEGAARVYGPQKGATPAMVAELDRGLRQLAEVVRAQIGKEILDLPGAGAAGGLAAGAVAFMNGRLVPGIDTVMQASGLAHEMKDADWILTGEGRFDAQSLRGKAVSGIVRLARQARARVAVIAGSIQVAPAEYNALGVTLVLSTQPAGMSLPEALAQAKRLLHQTAQEFARSKLGTSA